MSHKLPALKQCIYETNIVFQAALKHHSRQTSKAYLDFCFNACRGGAGIWHKLLKTYERDNMISYETQFALKQQALDARLQSAWRTGRTNGQSANGKSSGPTMVQPFRKPSPCCRLLVPILRPLCLTCPSSIFAMF